MKTKAIKTAAGFVAAIALLSGAFFLAGAVTPAHDQDQNNMNSMPGQGNRGQGRRRGKGNTNGNMNGNMNGNTNGNMNDNGNSNNTNNSNLR